MVTNNTDNGHNLQTAISQCITAKHCKNTEPRFVGWLEFSVPLQHKYIQPYQRRKVTGGSYPYPVKEG